MTRYYTYKGKEQTVSEIAADIGMSKGGFHKRLAKCNGNLKEALNLQSSNKLIDLVGKVFGDWTVLEKAGSETNTKQRMWLCECKCGNTSEIVGRNLRNGISTGCRDCCVKRQITHGMAGSSIYKIWAAMVQRCTNPEQKHYASYGGRGITVCKEWLEFENFYADMGDSNGLTLDRENNDLGYNKSNCRWATREEQSNNTRVTTMVTYKDAEYSLSALCKLKSISKDTVRGRLRRGWDIARAVETPIATQHNGGK